MEIKIVDYLEWSNCYQISNDKTMLIIPSSFGIRVIHFGFREGRNEFAVLPLHENQQTGWKIYGGHRLWYAPEEMPRTYQPDNEAIVIESTSQYIRVTQPRELKTGIIKEIDISLQDNSCRVKIVHRLYNTGAGALTLAPWAISVMAPGGRGIMPLSIQGDYASTLVAKDSLGLWSYTDLTDSRLTWMKRYILLTQDVRSSTTLKIGAVGSLGWVAYLNRGHMFLKTYRYQRYGIYPDRGCSVEMYTDHELLEIETLGPLVELESGETVEHTEYWYLFADLPDPVSEEQIEGEILPYIQAALD